MVEENWRQATEGLDRGACETWLTKLQESYSQERRTYHNLDSLKDKLKCYHEIRQNFKNPKAVLLALLFQNFEYNPKDLDGENKNLHHFTTFAEEAGISPNSELMLETQALLKAVATHSTEAHKVDGVFGSEDAHYLLDLDMSVLGMEPEKYIDYRNKIRGEYSFLSEIMYTALRLKVLQNFLQIPNIFATKEFREKYEEQARTNIQAEIEYLHKGDNASLT